VREPGHPVVGLLGLLASGCSVPSTRFARGIRVLAEGLRGCVRGRGHSLRHCTPLAAAHQLTESSPSRASPSRPGGGRAG
jgi:hypothetical protein